MASGYMFDTVRSINDHTYTKSITTVAKEQKALRARFDLSSI